MVDEWSIYNNISQKCWNHNNNNNPIPDRLIDQTHSEYKFLVQISFTPNRRYDNEAMSNDMTIITVIDRTVSMEEEREGGQRTRRWR